MLDAQQLRALLHYDRRTGVFTWRSGPRLIGRRTGWLCAGYLRITIKGRQYRAHRLAWLYVTGAWPTHEIDHRNRDKTDNRWDNLRPATRSQNASNRIPPRPKRPGLPRGVCPLPSGRFQARVKMAEGRRYIGSFDTPEAAYATYLEAAQRTYGEFVP